MWIGNARRRMSSGLGCRRDETACPSLSDFACLVIFSSAIFVELIFAPLVSLLIGESDPQLLSSAVPTPYFRSQPMPSHGPMAPTVSGVANGLKSDQQSSNALP